MSKENLNQNSKTGYESLYDLNLLGLWSQCGSDWSSMIKEETQAGINQPIKEEKLNLTNKVILFGVLLTLVFLVAAVLIQASTSNQEVQEVGISRGKGSGAM